MTNNHLTLEVVEYNLLQMKDFFFKFLIVVEHVG